MKQKVNILIEFQVSNMAINWTKIDLSSVCSVALTQEEFQEVLMNLIHNMVYALKIITTPSSAQWVKPIS